MAELEQRLLAAAGGPMPTALRNQKRRQNLAAASSGCARGDDGQTTVGPANYDADGVPPQAVSRRRLRPLPAYRCRTGPPPALVCWCAARGPK